MRTRFCILLAMAEVLGGCATRALSIPPAVPVPAAFSKGPVATSPGEADWWSAFNDPVLSGLVTRARAGNFDVQQAAARIRQAREQERITRGGQGPQISASAQSASTRLSKNALPSALANLFSGTPAQTGSASGLGLPGETFTTYQLGFDASWELDLFGGQRRANEAARARVEAAVWSARDAETILTAEVANTYEQYRALQRRVALAAETLATERESWAFIKVRAKHGLVTDSDVRRQQRKVQQAIAQREDLLAQTESRLHALGTLLGTAPTALGGELSGTPPDAPATPEVPPGLPSELLQRRPDIRAAEQRAAAAMADVGVASADLYPKISLTGALQLASRSLSSLLASDSLQDDVAGGVSLPLLNRGRLRANVRLRQAQAEETALAYRKTVFSALRDVEDALTRLDVDRRRLDQLRAVAVAAQDEAAIAAVRHRNGLVDAPEMLASKYAWQAARDAQIQAEAAAAQDIVALYKALGGGWGERQPLTNKGEPSGHGS